MLGRRYDSLGCMCVGKRRAMPVPIPQVSLIIEEQDMEYSKVEESLRVCGKPLRGFWFSGAGMSSCPAAFVHRKN